MSQSQAPITSPHQPSFPKFDTLPGELRLQIWRAAINGEDRGVHILGYPSKWPARVLTIDNKKFFDVPVWFFVNVECRETAEPYYTAVKVQITVDRKGELVHPDSDSTHVNMYVHMKPGNTLNFPFGEDSIARFTIFQEPDSEPESYIHENFRILR
ncbi:hypothetical protein F5Y03DRAFT_258931 [Xylaria venustula]|nr:hypothetical protein F5Y03DRAFT_258931 [Xylaria venustula]